MQHLEKYEEHSIFPNKVVRLNAIEGKSLPRAWREYKGLTQAETAGRLGVSQAALAQMERPKEQLRYATRVKLAQALGVEAEQLRE